MTTKEKMLKARDLIREGRYDEARAILEQINHPTAREWLAKLDARAPQSTADTARTSRPATRSSRRKQPARVRRSPLPLVTGIVTLLVVLVIGVVLILPRLNSDSDSGMTETVTDADAANANSTPENTPDSGSATTVATGGDSAGGDTVAGDVANVTSSGLRIPFLVNNGMLTVELPNGWECDCTGSSARLRVVGDVRSQVFVDLLAQAFSPDAYVTVPLADVIPNEIREGETISSQQSRQAGSREVLWLTITDDEGNTEHRYFAKDSDGHVLNFNIGTSTENPEQLQNAILFMLGTAEGDTSIAVTEFQLSILATGVAYNETLNRWRLTDTLSRDREHYVELPASWVIAPSGFLGLPMAVRSDQPDTSATAIVSVPRGFGSSGTDLTTVRDTYSRGQTLVTEETIQSGGRDVLFFVTSDPNNNNLETATYLTRDSSGEVVAFVIQPGATDRTALHNDIVFMAGNIETEPIDYLVLLRRVGILPSDATSDDGYEPAVKDTP